MNRIAPAAGRRRGLHACTTRCPDSDPRRPFLMCHRGSVSTSARPPGRSRRAGRAPAAPRPRDGAVRRGSFSSRSTATRCRPGSEAGCGRTLDGDHKRRDRGLHVGTARPYSQPSRSCGSKGSERHSSRRRAAPHRVAQKREQRRPAPALQPQVARAVAIEPLGPKNPRLPSARDAAAGSRRPPALRSFRAISSLASSSAADTAGIRCSA